MEKKIIRDSYYYTVRSDDVKVLKSRWNFVKTKTTTPGNNIYTLLITYIAFTSFISCKFQTLFFPYKLSYYATTGPYYAWATCGYSRNVWQFYIEIWLSKHTVFSTYNFIRVPRSKNLFCNILARSGFRDFALFLVFWKMFLVFGGCSGFSGGCSWFSGGCSGF